MAVPIITGEMDAHSVLGLKANNHTLTVPFFFIDFSESYKISDKYDLFIDPYIKRSINSMFIKEENSEIYRKINVLGAKMGIRYNF
jgi:hypothetical protein